MQKTTDNPSAQVGWVTFTPENTPGYTKDQTDEMTGFAHALYHEGWTKETVEQEIRGYISEYGWDLDACADAILSDYD